MTSVGLDLWVHGGVKPLNGVDYNSDLWIFRTSTLGWERVNTTTTEEGRHLSGRFRHTMTSVGLDLWVQGGQKEGGGMLKAQELW